MSELPAEIRAELLDIYARADAAVHQAAPVCELSGRCCRFEEYGHHLYITRPEADLLLEQGLPPDAVVEAGSCPFQINKLCTARERRPLGCRIFFCDPNYAQAGPLLMEQFLNEIKDLHRKHDLEWDYDVLFQFLKERQSPQSEEKTEPSSR
ncbi:MAG: hypothetical protein U0903_08205 [Planctomycetales bacterium]